MFLSNYINFRVVFKRVVMESVKSRLLKRAIKTFGIKELWIAQVANRKFDQITTVEYPPKSMKLRAEVKEKEYDGLPLFSLCSKNTTPKTTVFFVHGGGFVYRPMLHHWHFILNLITNCECEVLMPLYPLAPEHTYESIFKHIEKVYQTEIGDSKENNFIFMGDSAGASLILKLTQKLVLEKRKLPQAQILLSPWLDLSLSHPNQEELYIEDPVLDLKGIRLIGKMYAGDCEIKNPNVSPLFGDLSGLPPTVVCSGGCDLLAPDSFYLNDRIKEEDGDVNLIYYPSAIHDWMFFQIPEAEEVCGRIYSMIKENDFSI